MAWFTTYINHPQKCYFNTMVLKLLAIFSQTIPEFTDFLFLCPTPYSCFRLPCSVSKLRKQQLKIMTIMKNYEHGKNILIKIKRYHFSNMFTQLWHNIFCMIHIFSILLGSYKSWCLPWHTSQDLWLLCKYTRNMVTHLGPLNTLCNLSLLIYWTLYVKIIY